MLNEKGRKKGVLDPVYLNDDNKNCFIILIIRQKYNHVYSKLERNHPSKFTISAEKQGFSID